jgi:TatD DNase family protein
MWFDSHCHLDFPVFDPDRKQLIEAAREAGISQFVIPATQVSLLPQLQQLAKKHHCYYAAGLHPYWIEQHNDTDIAQLETYMQDERCVAVGESGLDATQPNIDRQLNFLEAHLELALTANKPIILHCRKMDQALLAMLRKQRYKHKVYGVIHGFSGSYQLACSYIELGFTIGVGGTITYSRAKKTRDTVMRIPLESIVLETDSPDMPVFGNQGQRNTPLRIIDVFNSLVDLRSESKETLQAQIFQNTLNLFQLK